MRYRLTKYINPKGYEWDEFLDIGKKEYFVTAEQYFYIENLYIQTASTLIDLKETERLKITDFEECPKVFEIMDISNPVLKETYCCDYAGDIYNFLYSGKRNFTGADFSDLLKILLRHEAWFRISVNDYIIDVGYEYYLHIYTSKNLFVKQVVIPKEISLELF
ncbi:MAG: hypothetical protein K2K57_11460 [Oscillospiraceae bacterium]|nr:hypothetical protein [Oscillospiraceae bacterium]